MAEASYTICVCPDCGALAENWLVIHHRDCPNQSELQKIEVVPAPDREYLDSVIAQSKQRLARILDLEDALREIATRPKVELNPDGVDQAAYTMALIAKDALGDA
jgi:hypothetical protein